MDTNNKLTLSAAETITQMALDKRIEDFLEPYTVKELDIFLEELSVANTSTDGLYNFYCKNCGLGLNFSSKTSKNIFERLHNIQGCSYQYVSYVKYKRTEKISGVVLKKDTTKSNSKANEKVLERINNLKGPIQEQIINEEAA